MMTGPGLRIGSDRLGLWDVGIRLAARRFWELVGLTVGKGGSFPRHGGRKKRKANANVMNQSRHTQLGQLRHRHKEGDGGQKKEGQRYDGNLQALAIWETQRLGGEKNRTLIKNGTVSKWAN